jgi:hypothetical protein
MNPIDEPVHVNILATILGSAFFAYAGWYYYFQPPSFHRAMEDSARRAPSFTRCLLAISKPGGLICFAASLFILAIAARHLVSR